MIKYLFVIILYFLPVAKARKCVQSTVNVRIYNESKYDIKVYCITIKGANYIYQDIKSHTYSQYQQLPYLYNGHKGDITFLKNRFFHRPDTVRIITTPIDNIGEKKFDTTTAVLNINILHEEKKFHIQTRLKEE